MRGKDSLRDDMRTYNAERRMLATVSCLTDLQAHKPEQLAVELIAHILPFQTDRAKSARVANIVWLAGW